MEKANNVAVLIDAENVPAAYATKIFDEASNYGNIVVKRIFADWSKASVKGWKDEVTRNSMTAVQQFEVQPRKNRLRVRPDRPSAGGRRLSRDTSPVPAAGAEGRPYQDRPVL